MKPREHRTFYTFSSLTVTGTYSVYLSASAIHINKIISSTLVMKFALSVRIRTNLEKNVVEGQQRMIAGEDDLKNENR